LTALATLTLVWLGAAPPDAAASATLERFARDRNATLAPPRAEPVVEGADPWSLVQRCETSLEQARDQLQAGDEQAARSQLAQVDQTLRQHPELLPAAWLMAQRHRVEANLLRRSAPERAAEVERLAETMEGARPPAFGESIAPRTAFERIRLDIVVHGARRAEIFWDGAPTARAISTTPGEHHLLVYGGERLAWAGWVSAFGAGKVDVWVPDRAPCSVADFEEVAMTGGALVSAPAGVRCGAWVAASPGPQPGSIAIALCSADRCERADIFSDRFAGAPPLEDRNAQKPIVPAWLAWSLAGVGVAAAASIVLWQTGVFDPAEQPKVYYDPSRL
jgi:hypothetical protein